MADVEDTPTAQGRTAAEAFEMLVRLEEQEPCAALRLDSRPGFWVASRYIRRAGAIRGGQRDRLAALSELPGPSPPVAGATLFVR